MITVLDHLILTINAKKKSHASILLIFQVIGATSLPVNNTSIRLKTWVFLFSIMRKRHLSLTKHILKMLSCARPGVCTTMVTQHRGPCVREVDSSWTVFINRAKKK